MNENSKQIAQSLAVVSREAGAVKGCQLFKGAGGRTSLPLKNQKQEEEEKKKTTAPEMLGNMTLPPLIPENKAVPYTFSLQSYIIICFNTLSL